MKEVRALGIIGRKLQHLRQWHASIEILDTSSCSWSHEQIQREFLPSSSSSESSTAFELEGDCSVDLHQVTTLMRVHLVQRQQFG